MCGGMYLNMTHSNSIRCNILFPNEPFRHADWKKNSDPVFYYKWMSTRRIIDGIMNKYPQYENINAINHEKCEAESDIIVKNKYNLDKRFPINDKFTVLLSTFNRVELVVRLIHHYTKSKYVDHIYIVWHNPRETPPRIMNFLAAQKKHPAITILQ